MATGIPISQLVSVVPGTIPATGILNFLNGLVLTQNVSAIPASTMKEFSTLSDVGLAFGVGSNEYKIAQPYFNGYANALQTPSSLFFAGYGSDSVPATFMNAAASQSFSWAAFTTAWEPALDVKQAFASWNGAQNSQYWYVPWDTDAQAATAGSTESFGAWLQTQSISGVTPVYLDPAVAGACLGWAACLNWDSPNGRQNLSFTRNSALSATVTDGATARALSANGYAFYGRYSGRAGDFTITSPAPVSGQFLWADSYINQMMINARLQSADVNTLINFGNIPFTVEGDTIISAGRQTVFQEALAFGAMNPGVSISDSQRLQIDRFFGVTGAADAIVAQGYYDQPGASLASAANRQARTIPNSRVAYADGQSVQFINIASREVV